MITTCSHHHQRNVLWPPTMLCLNHCRQVISLWSPLESQCSENHLVIINIIIIVWEKKMSGISSSCCHLHTRWGERYWALHVSKKKKKRTIPVIHHQQQSREATSITGVFSETISVQGEARNQDPSFHPSSAALNKRPHSSQTVHLCNWITAHNSPRFSFIDQLTNDMWRFFWCSIDIASSAWPVNFVFRSPNIFSFCFLVVYWCFEGWGKKNRRLWVTCFVWTLTVMWRPWLSPRIGTEWSLGWVLLWLGRTTGRDWHLPWQLRELQTIIQQKGRNCFLWSLTGQVEGFDLNLGTRFLLWLTGQIEGFCLNLGTRVTSPAQLHAHISPLYPTPYLLWSNSFKFSHLY